MINLLIVILFLLIVMYIAVGIGSSIAKFVLRKKLLPGFEDLADYV